MPYRGGSELCPKAGPEIRKALGIQGTWSRFATLQGCRSPSLKPGSEPGGAMRTSRRGKQGTSILVQPLRASRPAPPPPPHHALTQTISCRRLGSLRLCGNLVQDVLYQFLRLFSVLSFRVSDTGTVKNRRILEPGFHHECAE